MTDMLRVDEQPIWDGMTPRQMQVEIKRLQAAIRTNKFEPKINDDKVLIDALWEQIGRLLVERNTLRQLLIEERERNRLICEERKSWEKAKEISREETP